MVKARALDNKSDSGNKSTKLKNTKTKYKKKGAANAVVEEEDDGEETEVKDNNLPTREHLLWMLDMTNTLVGNVDNTKEQATKSKGCWDDNTLSHLGFCNIQVGGTDRDMDHENQDQGVSFVTKVWKKQ